MHDLGIPTPREVAEADLEFSKVQVMPSGVHFVPAGDFWWDTEMHVELVHCLADDDDVVQAARVSTVGVEAVSHADTAPSELLIKYLMKNRHGSPFEHNMFKFRVTAPIFVMREFHRHRVGWSYNEESARYKELDPHFWLPRITRKLTQTGRPGQYDMQPGTAEQHQIAEGAIITSCATAWGAYKHMLSEGIAREVARSVLPVNIYSTMYATCNARSLMHFLGLRTYDEHNSAYVSKPQAEIEQVALAMEYHLQRAMPLTHAAFQQYGRVSP